MFAIISGCKCNNHNSLVKHLHAQQQKQLLQNCHLFWWTVTVITSSFHQLLQLFRTHNLFPPPLRITVSGVWLQKHVQYFPRLLSITLPEGQPSAREEETRIKSWMGGSQPANCPQLTLLLLMHFLSQIWPACCFLPSNVLCFHSTLWSVKKLPENWTPYIFHGIRFFFPATSATRHICETLHCSTV